MKSFDSNMVSAKDNPIREYRLLHGVTQSQFARACDVHPSMISQIECGHVVPSLQVAFRITQYAGFSLERLARFCLRETLNLSGAVVVDFTARRQRTHN